MQLFQAIIATYSFIGLHRALIVLSLIPCSRLFSGEPRISSFRAPAVNCQIRSYRESDEILFGEGRIIYTWVKHYRSSSDSSSFFFSV